MENKRNCLVCGSETRSYHHPKINNHYHVCPKCEFISKEKSEIPTDEAAYTQYQTHRNSIEDERYIEYLYHFINSTLKPFIDIKGKCGLEFGSGPSPVLAELLSKREGAKMDIYDLFYAPEKVYEGKQYDFITSTEVIEHIENPIELFEFFKSHLKSGGILSVMTYFSKPTDVFLDTWHYMRDITHISFYSPQNLEYIAQKVGFELIFQDSKKCATFRKK